MRRSIGLEIMSVHYNNREGWKVQGQPDNVQFLLNSTCTQTGASDSFNSLSGSDENTFVLSPEEESYERSSRG